MLFVIENIFYIILTMHSWGIPKSVNRRKTDATNGQKKKNNQWSTKHYTKYWTTRTQSKTVGELKWSWRVSSSCSTSDIRRVTLVTNTVTSHSSITYLSYLNKDCNICFISLSVSCHIVAQTYILGVVSFFTDGLLLKNPASVLLNGLSGKGGINLSLDWR